MLTANKISALLNITADDAWVAPLLDRLANAGFSEVSEYRSTDAMDACDTFAEFLRDAYFFGGYQPDTIEAIDFDGATMTVEGTFSEDDEWDVSHEGTVTYENMGDGEFEAIDYSVDVMTTWEDMQPAHPMA